jgi:hypothetical protein
MNKAFVREPDFDGRAFCPRCGALGLPVEHGPLDAHIQPASRHKLGDTAWFCNFPRCEVAYFNLFDVTVLVDELKAPIYPHDLNAPMCACFGLTYDDVEADVRDGVPQTGQPKVRDHRTGGMLTARREHGSSTWRRLVRWAIPVRFSMPTHGRGHGTRRSRGSARGMIRTGFGLEGRNGLSKSVCILAYSIRNARPRQGNGREKPPRTPRAPRLEGRRKKNR